MTRKSDDAGRPRLLLLFASADHPHRDPVCATLAWLARAEGSLFECYFDSRHSGVHFGGGHPSWFHPADMRGPMVSGDRHIDALYLLLQHFRCEAACLGPALHEGVLRSAGVPIRSTSPDVATFYEEVFSASTVASPTTLLVVGDGGRPQGIPLTPYAFPEVVGRQALGVADGDAEAIAALVPGMKLESVWVGPDRRAESAEAGYAMEEVGEPPSDRSVATQTAWMSKRWQEGRNGFILGDPELVGRWTPTAVRRGWTPLYGVPQVDVIDKMAPALAGCDLAHGRQYHDSDFFRLSALGVSFQVIDPGSPPFPVVSEIGSEAPCQPSRSTPASTAGIDASGIDAAEPSDRELREWAAEGRVLTTLLFWSGMIRELQSLFPLSDLLSLTGLRCGLVLTTESYRYKAGTPLELLAVEREAGGLYPRVEPLLTDTGCGVIVAGEAPAERFASVLSESCSSLRASIGDERLVPRGWWAHMDAPLVPGRQPRISAYPDHPRLRLRYQPRELGEPQPGVPPSARHAIRASVRASRLGKYFAPLRPYEGHEAGPPSRMVLEAVGAAGLDYAITKSGFGPVPRVVTAVEGLVVFNHTAGRWDGWSPFITVNSLSDLRRAERALIRRKGPGWLVGALDTCLWAFTGPIWERGSELHDMCRWMVGGGASGRLVNVTPATVARYARIVTDLGGAEAIVPG